MKVMMKKAMVMLLIIAMFFSGTNMTAFGAEVTEEVSGESGSNSDIATDEQTLESLGFDLPENSEYNTDELNPGNHAITSMDEVAKELYGSNPWVDIYDNDLSSGAQALEDDAKKLTLYNGSTNNYSMSASFDGDGDGKKEYIARVYLEADSSGGNIMLSVTKAEYSGTYYDPVWIFKDQPTGGYVKTVTGIPLYSVRGLIGVEAGDFDGDGIDELAIYAPNNSDEVETTQQPWEPNRLEVKIYDIDVNSGSLGEPTQIIDVANGTYVNGVSEWKYSSNGSKKQYYSIPYLSMTADDVNGDGIDDLLTVANFATNFRNFGIDDKDTWKDMLDPNSCLTSMLDVYEGTRSTEGVKLEQTVTKRALIGKVDDECAYLLRNATAIVANVTGANSKEIVIGGNYTRVEYTPDTAIDTVVADTREVGIKDYTPRTIVGFTSYGTLKTNTAAAASLKYSWTRQNGNENKNYHRTTPNTFEPVSLEGFAAYGSAVSDTIFLSGQFFEYSSERKLECSSYELPKTVETGGSSGNRNRWLAEVTVGNVTNSAIGEETLYCVYYIRRQDKDMTSRVYGIWGEVSKNEKSYCYDESERLGVNIGCSVYMVDIDNDSSFIKYEQGSTDIYYGDVEVLSILQAAPVWKEFGEDYLENAETTYTKSSGTGSEETAGFTVSAGVVAGFEQETSFLGLFNVAGMSFETTVSASVGYETGKTVSEEYSIDYNTSGANDSVVIFTVPYVRYNCKIYIPTYTLPTKAEYDAKSAFLKELEENLFEYIDVDANVVGGNYSNPTDGFNNKYTTDVTDSNYESQLALYENYIEWLEHTESIMSEYNAGGTYEWGQEIEGGWEDYFYCVPQNPILTTVDVSTYDAIAQSNDSLSKIYGNVFDKDYKAGDPSTYASTIYELNAIDASKVLSGKTNAGSDADTGGFVNVTNISAGGGSVGQTISVSKENAQTISYGASIETQLTTEAGGAVVGVATSLEAGGTNCKVTTSGSEYSGTVPSLPSGTSNDYSYSWKLVSYTAKLNGKKIPVVGYLTKLEQTPPPSVPSDLTVTELTDNKVTLEWTDGDRKASYFEVYRVTYSNGKTYYDNIQTVEKNASGTYSCTDNGVGEGLEPETSYYYTVKAFSDKNVESTYSDIVECTTLPANTSINIFVEGMDNDTECIAGKDIELSTNVVSETDSTYYVRSYKWQCNKGFGWEDAEGKNDGSTYTFRASTLKNGYQYRCKVEVRVGSIINGSIYDLYSNMVTQNAKRAVTTVSLMASAVDGSENISAAYGPINSERIFEAQINTEENMDADITGEVVFTVTYESTAENVAVMARSRQATNTEVTTYKANVSEGIATVNLMFEEPGTYTIDAEYGGNDNCEGSSTVDGYTYYVYEEDASQDIFDFDNADVFLDESSYKYTGSQICPKVTVIWNEVALTEDVDYTVSYGANDAVGSDTGCVTVTPAGNFADQEAKVVYFDIEKGIATINTAEDSYTAEAGESPFSLGAVTNVNKKLTYTGYDETIISVDENGMVTPLAVGTTSITIALENTDNYELTEKVVSVKVSTNVVKEVENLIAAIGIVDTSEECKMKIDAAREAYKALTEEKKALVTNLSILESAESKYQELKTKEEEEAAKKEQEEKDKAAAKVVEDLIAAIGTVDTSEECKIKINAAREAYKSLTQEQKAYVSNLSVLKDAEYKYEELKLKEEEEKQEEEAKKEQEEKDKAAAKAVENLIAAIGTVDTSEECKAKIDAAKEAYKALTEAQKAYVTSLSVLENAESKYEELKTKEEEEAAKKEQEEKDKAAAKAVENLIAAIGTVDTSEECKAKIDAAKEAYKALTEAQKAYVTSLSVLENAESEYEELKTKEEEEAAKKEQEEAAKKEQEEAAKKEQEEQAKKEEEAKKEQEAKELAQAGTIAIEESKQAITTANTDKGDVAGSSFIAFKLKAKGANKSIKLSWSKVSGAEGYMIYGAVCGKPMELIGDVSSGKKSYTVKKLAKGKYYKYMLVAYKTIYGEKRAIETSVTVHAATNGGKQGNPTAVTHKKAKVTVKVKRTTKLKPILKTKGKVKTHIAKFRYESSNPSIATVDKKGKIKGMAKGKCDIYIYSQNGMFKKVKVTVK